LKKAIKFVGALMTIIEEFEMFDIPTLEYTSCVAKLAKVKNNWKKPISIVGANSGVGKKFIAKDSVIKKPFNEFVQQNTDS
jgi:hypothetical protein